MKKICFVTFQFQTGGVERVLCALTSKLKDADVKLVTVTDQTDGILENLPSNVSFIKLTTLPYFRFLEKLRKVRLIGKVASPINLLSRILYLRFSKEFSDTIFVNFADTISTMLLAYYGNHSKYTISWLHYNPKTFLKSKYKKIYTSIYRKFSKIVCICQEQKGIMMNIIPSLKEDNVKVIYNILDYEYMTREMNEPFDAGYHYIVMVARFDLRSKDFKTIIDAYSMLSDELKSKYKLVFVGAGPDQQEIEKYSNECGEEDNIVFAGMQKNPYKWIKNAEILVHSSKSEGLPTVLLEAFQCGTPVISTNCETGPTEILAGGGAGVLVNVGDSEALKASMEKLLNDESLRKEYARKGKERLEQFLPDTIMSKVNELWK